MTKKDYEKAAKIVNGMPSFHPNVRRERTAVENAFVQLFKDDNPQFDEVRFRAACNKEKK